MSDDTFARLSRVDDGLVWLSRVTEYGDRDLCLRTPNRQEITGLVVKRRDGRDFRLLVHTRSRVYYLRRNKLRLWRLL